MREWSNSNSPTYRVGDAGSYPASRSKRIRTTNGKVPELFHGSIPADMRSLIREYAGLWPSDKDVYVGCSGNFTIERVLHPLGRTLHSNDIQGYSSALGWYLSEGRVPFTIREEWEDDLAWTAPYMENDLDRIATLMLGTTFLPLIGKSGVYPARMLDAYQRQFPHVHAKTVERMKNLELTVASYHAMDVVEWVENVVPSDSPIVMFPPFYGGDYESQFEGFSTFYDWPEPTYPELDEDRKDRLMEVVTKRPHWMVGLHLPRPELAEYLRGRVQTTNRGVPIYVYASHGPTRIVMPRQRPQFIDMPKLGMTEDITGPLRLHYMTSGQFASERSQFMSKNIVPGQPVLAVGVSAGGKFIGCFAFANQKHSHTDAYMLSDFPVSWTKYKDLAKLIVMTAMSTEAQTMVQRTFSRSIETISTTAFSRNPVSMKYRGAMKLVKRTENPKDHEEPFMLQYQQTAGQMTLAETFDKWMKKNGKKLKQERD